MMRGKGRFGIFVFLLMVFGLVAGAQAEKVTVGIPAPSISQVAFYVGVDKGFYKEEGLDVQLILMRAPIANVALMANELHFNGIPTAGLGAALRGAPLRILSTTFYRPLFSLMAKPEYRSVPDLKGKILGNSGRGSAVDLLMAQLFKRHGLVVGRDVPSISAGNSRDRLAAMLSGTIDATLLVLPWNLRAEAAGMREIMSFTNEQFVLFVGSVVANTKLLKANPDLVKRFMRGTLKGLIYGHSNRAGTIEVMGRKLGLTKTNATRMYDIAQPVMTKDGTVSEELQKRYFDVVVKVRKVKNPKPYKNFIDFSLIKEVAGELKAQGWKP